MGMQRQSTTQEDRRRQVAEIDSVARAIIEQRRVGRAAKTAQLRQARERMEAEEGHPD